MEQQAQTAGHQVARLTIVYIGTRQFVGVRPEGTEIKPGVVDLEDAMELHVMMDPRQNRAAVQVMLTPIFPYGGPHTIKVAASLMIDATEVPDLGRMYNAFTGKSRVLIPGMGL